MKSSRFSEAFTIVEMLVVIGILSLVASMVVPSFTMSLDRTRAERYARSLRSSMMAAQMNALAKKQCFRIRFEITSGSRVEVSRYSERDCQTTGGSWSRSAGLTSFRLPPSVRIYSAGDGMGPMGDDSGEACVYFESDGSISPVFDCSEGNRTDDGSRGTLIIHLGPAGLNFSGPDPCNYATVYMRLNDEVNQPNYSNYGVYDEFTTEPGDDPSC